MIPTISLSVALALVLSQDATQDTQAKAEDAAAKRAAITAKLTAALGNTPGMTMTGRLDRESPFAGMGFGPSIAGGLVGKLSACVDKNGVVYARVESDNGKLEIWQKGKKAAQRFTWSGTSSPQIGNVAAELLRLFDFGRVGRELADAEGIKKTSLKTIHDRQCQGYAATFEPDLVEADRAGGMVMSLVVQEVAAKFWLDVETGALARADFTIVSGLPQNVRIGGAGDAADLVFETVYSFVATSTKADLVHKVPEEIGQKLR